MDPWQILNDELDTWAAGGQVADLWWRDDDAVAPGPQLDRLFSITETTGLLLAVIPAKAEQALATQVQDVPYVKVAQHGYAHINHADRGQGLGAWELGLHRGERVVMEELHHGRELLEGLFADNFLPIIVPPWNRLDAKLLKPVKESGYAGVSLFGPRQGDQSSLSFSVVNSHCDPIRWKGGAAFKGVGKTVNQLVEHLQARREGIVDASEPTGFLTHHIVLDNECWTFCEELADQINSHPAARWCKDVSAIFGTGS